MADVKNNVPQGGQTPQNGSNQNGQNGQNGQSQNQNARRRHYRRPRVGNIKKPIEGIKRPIEGIRKFVTRRPAIEEVVHETTSGGIIFRRNPKTRELEVLLIQDAKNRWTIPKGHVEEGEEPKDTAEREIREETGLQEMRVMNWLGKVNFRYRREHTLVLMTMHIYLVHGRGDTNKLHPEDWLSDIQWLPATKAVDSIAYEDIGKLMLVGMKKIKEAGI